MKKETRELWPQEKKDEAYSAFKMSLQNKTWQEYEKAIREWCLKNDY